MSELSMNNLRWQLADLRKGKITLEEFAQEVRESSSSPGVSEWHSVLALAEGGHLKKEEVFEIARIVFDHLGGPLEECFCGLAPKVMGGSVPHCGRHECHMAAIYVDIT